MHTTNELSGIDEINMLISARRKAILIETYEEQRVQKDLKEIITNRQMGAVTWSITGGGFDLIEETKSEKFNFSDPIKLMNAIKNSEEQNVFILKDFHDIWTNYQAKRALRDVLEKNDEVYKPIIFLSPFISIPAELEKLITTVRYELPSRAQVIEQLEGLNNFLITNDLPVAEGREREAIIHSLVGMTKTEINNVLKKSVSKHKKISLEEITAEKEQVIRKTGLLEYITKLGDMKNVGGMDIFKDWISDAYYAFAPEAREYNIDPARGVIMAGFPGSGKSLSAKSLANSWNLPLLKMNMSQIMDSKVGQSEKNIDRALKLAEDVSPCVLWIDELEKGLSGISSSDKSDSGTLSRVVQSLLTWLSDKVAPVFVVATANDITNLPPELTRAGRFDEIFFVSIPSPEERKDILSIHLKKRGYEISEQAELAINEFPDYTLAEIAEEMDGFTGAEIEQVVAEAGRRAYAEYKKEIRDMHYMTKDDLISQAAKTIPMSRRNNEVLYNLREWAKEAAKCASSFEHDIIHHKNGTNKNKIIEFDDIEI
ncbi:AAA family ATPase [Virgibacillus salexigens]|uniref:Uncharacterized AAA domain-containing protein ycf46 n=1 Tax=Virgibacillus massiliensis TaxID=1462526 RepID=A0A024QIY2_9BACI|nr:AAA family ATPase [Virgibacillus massiliensis]CDQ41911.1 ATP-dependent zinc metalloprotease FtsH [Virgibacillus massiliensis]